MESKPAVAVVFHHIGPYHHARLNAAADRLSVIAVEWSARAYDPWGAADSPARYHMHGYVHLPAFKEYDELPIYYALAKAFVHASLIEQWGLVVNEAISSGLPVIVSKRCGCVPELVADNGFTFDPTDERELAARLFEMASLSENERKCFKAASRRIAGAFELTRFGEGLESAAKLATTLPRKQAGSFDRALLSAVMRYTK
jgi:glycosyltransferase involved in cell wall biosynthesis